MIIKVQNLQIHYKIFGTGEDLLFLHGWGRSFADYENICIYLAKKFRVIALDLPGFGLSALPQTAWKTEQYAQFLKEFIEMLKVNNPILVGHSLGGKIALYATAEHLVDTKKLFLISSAGVKTRKTIRQNIKTYIYKAVKKVASLPLGKQLLSSYLHHYRNKIGSQDYRNAQGIMRQILVYAVNDDLRQILPKIQVPTLLVWGAKDTSAPLVTGQGMEKLIHNSKLVVFPDSGHFPHEEHFSELCQLLDEFL